MNNGYRKICYEEVKILKNLDLSFKEISKILNVPLYVVSRIYKKGPGYCEKIGNKKKLKEKIVFPIWKNVSPHVLYNIIPAIIYKYYGSTILSEILIDFVLDWLYSREVLYQPKKKIDNFDAFALKMAKRIIVNFNKHLSKYDKLKLKELKERKKERVKLWEQSLGI